MSSALEYVFVYGVTAQFSEAGVCAQNEVCLFFSFADRTGRAEQRTQKPAGQLYTDASEADEGGVNLANAGQRQHDLPPVLWVLL